VIVTWSIFFANNVVEVNIFSSDNKQESNRAVSYQTRIK